MILAAKTANVSQVVKSADIGFVNPYTTALQQLYEASQNNDPAWKRHLREVAKEWKN
jgi:hypothetical protein